MDGFQIAIFRKLHFAFLFYIYIYICVCVYVHMFAQMYYIYYIPLNVHSPFADWIFVWVLTFILLFDDINDRFSKCDIHMSWTLMGVAVAFNFPILPCESFVGGLINVVPSSFSRGFDHRSKAFDFVLY